MKSIKIKWRIAGQEIIWRMYDEEGRPVIGRIKGEACHLGGVSTSVEYMKQAVESDFWLSYLKRVRPKEEAFVFEYVSPEPEKIQIKAYYQEVDNEIYWQFKGLTDEVLASGSGSICTTSDDMIRKSFFNTFPELSPDQVVFTWLKTEPKSQFMQDLEALINKHSLETGSDTPDFLIASFLKQSLDSLDSLIRRRDKWKKA